MIVDAGLFPFKILVVTHVNDVSAEFIHVEGLQMPIVNAHLQPLSSSAVKWESWCKRNNHFLGTEGLRYSEVVVESRTVGCFCIREETYSILVNAEIRDNLPSSLFCIALCSKLIRLDNQRVWRGDYQRLRIL